MTNFWNSTIGPVDGKIENAFVADFSAIIPNNTKAVASIKKFDLIDSKYGKFYQIIWEIVSEDFNGAEVKQKIKAFEADEKKKFRALNMLKLIFNLCNVPITDKDYPQMPKLLQFLGKRCGLKVREVFLDNGRRANWISEVHPQEDFKCEVGKAIEKDSNQDKFAGLTDSLQSLYDTEAKQMVGKELNPPFNDDLYF